jgi:capsular exopolysaccharide synthesis family protein
MFELPNHTGLSSLFVRSELDTAGVLQPSKIDGLSILTSGELPPNPYELLNSRKMADIVGELKSRSALVVFDTAPVAVVSDAVVLSRLVDGVLLVIKPGKTSLGVIQHTLEQFKRAGARILGVVLNDVELKRTGYAPYYREYTYVAYGEAGEEKRSWIKRVLRRPKNRQPGSDQNA